MLFLQVQCDLVLAPVFISVEPFMSFVLSSCLRLFSTFIHVEPFLVQAEMNGDCRPGLPGAKKPVMSLHSPLCTEQLNHFYEVRALRLGR